MRHPKRKGNISIEKGIRSKVKCANSSAVFRFRGTKFGREVGGGCGKSVGLLVSMETDLYPQETGFSLTAQPFGRWG